MAKQKMVFTAPWYPWYVKDVLNSERVKMLSLAEEGAYRRALDNAWIEGSMPADPSAFARVIGSGCTTKIAKKVIETCFSPMPENESRLVNKKLEKIREEQRRKFAVKSATGKKNIAKRWKQVTSGDSNGIATVDQRYSIQKQIQNKKEEEKELPNGSSKKTPDAPRKAVPKLTRLPEPFTMTPERWAWLAEHLPGLDDPNGAHANFVEYWTNAPPGKAEKVNWELTWQKGMRNAKKWQDEDKRNGKHNGNGSPDRRTDSEILRDSAEQIASKYSN
jgi:uncharacterized protein YdaU (DUF1376 family)